MFRFTIRELVLLTIIVAMGAGWWLDRRGLAIHYADYERLKAEERKVLAERKEFFEILRKASHAAAEQMLKPSSVAPSPLEAHADVAPLKTINVEEAAEIVRRMIQKESGGETAFDCDASESDEGYSVFVTFGVGRDANGKLIGIYPGGHTLYKLSKTGKVLKIVGGA